MVTGSYLYAVGYNILEVKDGTASLLSGTKNLAR
jgi:hypothetical protein